MRRVHGVVLTLTLMGTVLAIGTTSAGAAPVLPAQFSDALVASVGQPTALAFLPDGRMLVTTQPGRLRVVSGGTLLPTPALDLSGRICSNSERGLLGVAADPDAASKAFYVYYTARGSSSTCPTGSANPAGAPTNRVSRFVIRDDNTVEPASETILLDGIYSNAGNHNAGDLQVGKDGHLYVSTGDGGCDYKGDSGCAGSDNTAQTRDRNAANSPDQRYDTLTHLQKPQNPNAFWELAVPNGTYRVRAVSGDPSNVDGTYRLNAEGVTVVNGTPTSAQRWIEGTVTVSVTDGRLTVSNGSGAVNNKLNFVEVTLL